MAETPQQISNSVFMEGGSLYPGGTGRITEMKYVLWDYDGKRAPDSVFAVMMSMQPTDGSNEGKPLNVHWASGNPKEFQPNHDGSFAMALQPSTAPNIRNNTNWKFVRDKFRDNCGLQDSYVDGPTGIRALIGSEITLIRMDQPERNIQDDGPPLPAGQNKKTYKPTILVPSRCKYPWEVGVAGAKANTAATAVAPRPANATPTTTGAPAPNVATNGHGDIDATIMECIAEILTAETIISMPNLPKLLMERLNTRGVTAQQRLAYLPKVKDTAYVQSLADVNGWAFDGSTLAVG